MTIELKPEQERVIEQAIEAGLIRNAEDVIDIGIESVREQLQQQPARRDRSSSPDWPERLHRWIQSHSSDAPLLSDEAISRESIYGDRGL